MNEQRPTSEYTIRATIRMHLTGGEVTRVIIEPDNGYEVVSEGDEWATDYSQNNVDDALVRHLDRIGHVFGGLATYPLEWEG